MTYEPPRQVSQAGHRHRTFGVVSLAIAALLPLGLGILLFALYVANKVTYDHDVKNAIASAIVIYYFFVAPILHAVGFVVGVVGLFPRRSAKLPSLAGALANLALPILGALLFFFAIALSAAAVVR